MKKSILVNILKNKKAFTLLELLVVVAIIGILSAVGVYGYNEYTYAAKLKVLEYQKSSLIRLVNAELAKCALNQKDSSGWVRVMDGWYYCNWYNLPDRDGLLMYAVVNYGLSKFTNPFQSDKIEPSGYTLRSFLEYSAVIPNNDIYLGKLIFNLRNRLIYCIKTPCNNPNNQRLEIREFFKDGY